MIMQQRKVFIEKDNTKSEAMQTSEHQSDYLLMSHLEDGHLIYRFGGTIITSDATETGTNLNDTGSFVA